jgi:hypothetical protein
MGFWRRCSEWPPPGRMWPVAAVGAAGFDGPVMVRHGLWCMGFCLHACAVQSAESTRTALNGAAPATHLGRRGLAALAGRRLRSREPHWSGDGIRAHGTGAWGPGARGDWPSPGPAAERGAASKQEFQRRCRQMHADARGWDTAHRIGTAHQDQPGGFCRERPCGIQTHPRVSACICVEILSCLLASPQAARCGPGRRCHVRQPGRPCRAAHVAWGLACTPAHRRRHRNPSAALGTRLFQQRTPTSAVWRRLPAGGCAAGSPPLGWRWDSSPRYRCMGSWRACGDWPPPGERVRSPWLARQVLTARSWPGVPHVAWGFASAPWQCRRRIGPACTGLFWRRTRARAVRRTMPDGGLRSGKPCRNGDGIRPRRSGAWAFGVRAASGRPSAGCGRLPGPARRDSTARSCCGAAHVARGVAATPARCRRRSGSAALGMQALRLRRDVAAGAARALRDRTARPGGRPHALATNRRPSQPELLAGPAPRSLPAHARAPSTLHGLGRAGLCRYVGRGPVIARCRWLVVVVAALWPFVVRSKWAARIERARRAAGKRPFLTPAPG